MDTQSYVHTLAMPLPEDIMKRKWAGDLTGAMKAIDLRLTVPDLPEMLKQRLICEKEILRRLPTQYPWNRQEAIAKLRELIPSATPEDFDRLELEGYIDFLYINGEKKYFVRFHKSVQKINLLCPEKLSPESPWLDPMIRKIIEKGSLSRRITLRSSLHHPEDSFVPGDYRVWLPLPICCAQQEDIRVEAGDPDQIAPETAAARTAFWQRHWDTWQKPELQYSYTAAIRYADPLNAPAPTSPLYPREEAPTQEDLAEDGCHIRFTPYLRELARSLAEGETTPARKAWRFYEFITTHVKYSFVRDYFQIDDLAEYCALNLKGDCGLQALLFIALCRISGIPARWQSGLSISSDYVGSHDWAQFWLDGWGWLFADPSYGGGAWRNGSILRHRFYFGNIDPMRMAANRLFQAPLSPATGFFRVDPYDNQSGEMERIGAELPFTGRDLDDEIRLVNYQDL